MLVIGDYNMFALNKISYRLCFGFRKRAGTIVGIIRGIIAGARRRDDSAISPIGAPVTIQIHSNISTDNSPVFSPSPAAIWVGGSVTFPSVGVHAYHYINFPVIHEVLYTGIGAVLFTEVLH
jgi:hypothetical protein